MIAGLADWMVAVVSGGGILVIFFAPGWLGWYSFDANFGAGLIYYSGLPITRVVVILRFVLNAVRIRSTCDTFGHRLFGLRVVKVDGERIGWWRALAR